MEEATFLTRFASKVVIVHRRDEFRASPIMVDRARENEKVEFVLNAEVDEVLGEGNGHVTGLRLRDTATGETTEIDADGLFVAVGHDPTTALFLDWLDHDDGGLPRHGAALDADEHPRRLRRGGRPGPHVSPGRDGSRLGHHGRTRCATLARGAAPPARGRGRVRLSTLRPQRVVTLARCDRALGRSRRSDPRRAPRESPRSRRSRGHRGAAGPGRRRAHAAPDSRGSWHVRLRHPRGDAPARDGGRPHARRSTSSRRPSASSPCERRRRGGALVDRRGACTRRPNPTRPSVILIYRLVDDVADSYLDLLDCDLRLRSTSRGPDRRPPAGRRYGVGSPSYATSFSIAGAPSRRLRAAVRRVLDGRVEVGEHALFPPDVERLFARHVRHARARDGGARHRPRPAGGRA